MSLSCIYEIEPAKGWNERVRKYKRNEVKQDMSREQIFVGFEAKGRKVVQLLQGSGMPTSASHLLE